MSKQLVFTRKYSPQGKIQTFIKKYKLKCSYTDKHENIYLNEFIIMSVTKRVIWILLIEQPKYPNIETDINNYFNNGKHGYEKPKRNFSQCKLIFKK